MMQSQMLFMLFKKVLKFFHGGKLFKFIAYRCGQVHIVIGFACLTYLLLIVKTAGRQIGYTQLKNEMLCRKKVHALFKTERIYKFFRVTVMNAAFSTGT